MMSPRSSDEADGYVPATKKAWPMPFIVRRPFTCFYVPQAQRARVSVLSHTMTHPTACAVSMSIHIHATTTRLHEVTARVRGHPAQERDVEARAVLEPEEGGVDPHAGGEGDLAG